MSRPDRLSFVDFARGFAIASIVAFHALSLVATGVGSSVIRFGAAGVHAFLFLSGFGLTLAASQSSLQGFYRRRFRRILVPYYVFVTSVFVLNLVWPIYPGQGLREYLGHVLLYKMFDETLIGSFGYHLWFVSTIIQFYIIFPWLFRCMQRMSGAKFLCVSAAVSAGFTLWLIATDRAALRVFNSCALVYLGEFALGMLAAKSYQNRGVRFWEIPPGWLGTVTCLGIALQGVTLIWGGPDAELLNNPASLIGYGGLLIIGYRICQRRRLVWVNTMLCALGAISYELYLVHGLIVTRTYWFVAPATVGGKLLVILAAVAMSVLAAIAFHRLLGLANSPSTPPIAVRKCSAAREADQPLSL